MAINQSSDSNNSASVGNTTEKIFYGAAAIVGAAFFGLGIYNGIQSGNLKEALSSFWNKDSGRALLAVGGGALLLCGVGNKVRHPGDSDAAESTRVCLIAGSTLTAVCALTFIGGSDSGESQSINTAPPATAVSNTNTTDNGSVAIVSTPPGMCEINIPYKSSDTPSVIKMQSALYNEGYYSGPIDGINGSDTKGSLREFKTEKGFDTSTNFNEEMCAALSAELVDGDPVTPVAKVGG